MIKQDNSYKNKQVFEYKFDKSPSQSEESKSNPKECSFESEIGDYKDQNNFLPNSVRWPTSKVSRIDSSKETFWNDFRIYLVNESQRKHSVRNKVGYAK
ncbi:MAG: hypothetical protein AB7V56_16230 [Candidatus Nitrosocosmicus sp.]